MQVVTADFARIYGRLGARDHHGKGKRGPRSAELKNQGHRRHRAEVRRFLGRQEWDSDTIDARPITGWDAF
jgi:hypothetical protein